MSRFLFEKPFFTGTDNEKIRQAEAYLARLVNQLENLPIDNREAPEDGNTSDIVIQQGVTDKWTYRKWKSGIAECWASIEYTIGEMSSDVYLSPGMYVSLNSYGTLYPRDLFISEPVHNVTFDQENGNYSMMTVNNSKGTKESTPSYMILCKHNDISGGKIRFNYHATGRWK